MTSNLSVVIFLLFFITGNLSYAQSNDATKTYSGYLHKDAPAHRSFLGSIFGQKSTKEAVDHDRECSLEFRYPAAFAAQPPVELPGKIAYFVRFKNLKGKETGVPKRFIIKIYANDEQEYLLDPNAASKKTGPNGEHYFSDMYLKYLVLGGDINHIEIISTSGDNKGKYVLGQVEINDGS